MSEYIVSARKYRPDSFETLYGQDNIAQTLRNSIKRGQLAHAYLFCGPRGVGKTTVARIFAKIINCEHPSEDLSPCGHCESCVSFQEGRSYCIHEMDAASNNSVDDIRSLIDQVNIPPQVGKYSVYIVDEVHMLSQAAFNAFLKTLEEPPSHAIFILATTEKHKLLPTILSRCQTYDFNRISVPDMVSNLRSIAQKEGVTIGDESLHAIGLKADGAMRDALTLFDQTVAFCGTEVRHEDVLRNLNVLDYENCFSLVDNFLAGDHQAALLKFDEILNKGFNALYFLSVLSSHLRDLIVARGGGMDALLELPQSVKVRYKEQASRCTLQFLYDALSVTTQCEAGYKSSVNPRLHIEFALIRLSFIGGGKLSPTNTQPKTAAPPAPGVRVSSTQAVAASPSVSGTVSVQPAQRVAMRRSSRGAAGLSISGLTAASETAGRDAPPKETIAMGETMPDDEAICLRWKEMAADYSAKPRLATAIASAKLDITTNDGTKVVTFLVANVAQKNWIEGKLLKELEGKLQHKLSSSSLRLAVGLTEVNSVVKESLTRREKAEKLIATNSEVRALVEDLDLDV